MTTSVSAGMDSRGNRDGTHPENAAEAARKTGLWVGGTLGRDSVDRSRNRCLTTTSVGTPERAGATCRPAGGGCQRRRSGADAGFAVHRRRGHPTPFTLTILGTAEPKGSAKIV